MRKSVFIFLLLISPLLRRGAGGEAYGQTSAYHPFPDSAFWRVDRYDSWHTCQVYHCYNYFFSGDTMINGITYKKLMRANVSDVVISAPSCNLLPLATSPGYVGAIKDDPISNKSFFVSTFQSTDTLLFDYNLQVGDTLKGWLATGTCPILVASIDSVSVGAEFRKRWNLNICGNPLEYFIQGIGSGRGLIEPLPNSSFGDFNLICAKDSTSISYITTSYSPINCQLITSVGSPDSPENKYRISPNPSPGNFKIEATEKFQYSVYDIFGTEIMHSDNLQQSVTLNLSAQPQGIYFVIGKSGDKVFSRKIILQ